MPRQFHDLKIETKYFQEVEQQFKTFEIRLNDRNYKVYDMVTLHEIVNGTKTGREIEIEISYILHGPVFGLKDGWCAFCWNYLDRTLL